MENKAINLWKLGCTILTILVIILLVIVLKNHSSKGGNNSRLRNDQNSTNIDSPIRIMLDEDLSKDGVIDGIENVRWNNARIRQVDNQMEISIMLNNESETEKVEAKDLTVDLLDIDKKVIFTKDVKMEEISANFGYTSLEFTCEINEPVVIHDIQIIAK